MSGCHLITAEADKTIKMYKEDETGKKGYVKLFMSLLVMLGPDYESVLSDRGKSSYCMEVRNCSEDDICMASILTYTHRHTQTHTQTHTHTHGHTQTHTHTCTHTHTHLYTECIPQGRSTMLCHQKTSW